MPDLFRRIDKVRIGKVGVACRGAMPVVPEKPADERQTFARHNRLTCGGMAQVRQAQTAELRVRADRAPGRDGAGRQALKQRHNPQDHAMVDAGRKCTNDAWGV